MFKNFVFGLVCFWFFFSALSLLSSLFLLFAIIQTNLLPPIFPSFSTFSYLSHLPSLLCPKINFFFAIFVVLLLFFCFFSGTRIGENKAAGFAPPALQPLDEDKPVGAGGFVIWSHLRLLFITLPFSDLTPVCRFLLPAGGIGILGFLLAGLYCYRKCRSLSWLFCGN